MANDAPAPGRPPAGPGHYLRDLVSGATDGIVTTLAIVVAASAAQMEPRVAIILGLANLGADGLSMGASNYLALKSELHQVGASVAEEKPWRHGGATFAAFVLAGAIPLATLVAPPVPGLSTAHLAVLLSALALAGAGAARARFTLQRRWAAGLEMLVVAGLAALVAWLVGASAAGLVA